jgi:hypothetical protein
MACVNNIKEVLVNGCKFDEDKELDDMAHTFNLMRLGKQIRATTKLDKELCVSIKPTHKKSKNMKKWE